MGRGFGVGDVNYPHVVIDTGNHPVCPARHLGDGHVNTPARSGQPG